MVEHFFSSDECDRGLIEKIYNNLVNIEVPVPKLTSEQSRELMSLSNKDDLPEPHSKITLMKSLVITGKVFAVLAVVSLVGFSSSLIALRLRSV